jgi:hypothetical protein
VSALENLTDFAAACVPSVSRDDRLLTLVVVSARFELPPAGARSHEPPRLLPEQGEVRLADEYEGEGASSMLLREGQSAYTRPGTDIYLRGHAWAPRGRPVERGGVELRVGPHAKRALVFGERTWTRGVTGVSPGRADSFTAIPLTYRRCFGGESSEYNPVGCGLHMSSSEAVGSPLPNFEDPEALLHGPADRPLPCGFGPVARHWRPRRAFGGTYDRAWAEQRVPLWPKDLDERFFSAAAPGLSATPHLVGGELVQLVGVSPDGDYQFSLPQVHLQARFEVGAESTRRRLVLDAIEFDADAGVFTMWWRAYVVADPLKVGGVVVRALAPWELQR